MRTTPPKGEWRSALRTTFSMARCSSSGFACSSGRSLLQSQHSPGEARPRNVHPRRSRPAIPAYPPLPGHRQRRPPGGKASATRQPAGPGAHLPIRFVPASCRTVPAVAARGRLPPANAPAATASRGTHRATGVSGFPSESRGVPSCDRNRARDRQVHRAGHPFPIRCAPRGHPAPPRRRRPANGGSAWQNTRASAKALTRLTISALRIGTIGNRGRCGRMCGESGGRAPPSGGPANVGAVAEGGSPCWRSNQK